MVDELLTPAEAARRLGIRRTTLYDWLGQSDRGLLSIRGAPLTIDYLQSGPQGQGKIALDAAEVERIRQAMRVMPTAAVIRRPRMTQVQFPHINVPLGRPDRR